MFIIKKNKKIFKFSKRKFLSPWLSSIFAWCFLLLIYFSPINYEKLDSLPFFIKLSALIRDIITDISILILIINSLLSRYKIPKIYWMILNIPLLSLSPFVLIHLLGSIFFTYLILFIT